MLIWSKVSGQKLFIAFLLIYKLRNFQANSFEQKLGLLFTFYFESYDLLHLRWHFSIESVEISSVTEI
jgi:hypothetical protein